MNPRRLGEKRRVQHLRRVARTLARRWGLERRFNSCWLAGDKLWLNLVVFRDSFGTGGVRYTFWVEGLRLPERGDFAARDTAVVDAWHANGWHNPGVTP